MDPQRLPKRPATQVPPARPGKAPTSRQPAVRPSTQVPPARTGTSRQPAVKPPTIHNSPTTRMPQERSTTRSVPRSGRSVAAKKNNLPLILGIAGGGLLLIILIAIMAGGTKKHPEASNTRPAPKGVDVASIEREAEAKCEQGMGIVQKCEGLMTGRELNSGEKSKLKVDLEKGLALLVEGMSGFDKANSMVGKTYDVVKYSKTMKAARMKLGELGSK
ncbi:MAG TPA: hypothetical protein VF950_16225 [Planctomycetota bacterium]